MNIYYTVVDYGDGSYGTRFFFDRESIIMLQEAYPDAYPEDSWGSFTIKTDSAFISNLSIAALEDVNDELG